MAQGDLDNAFVAIDRARAITLPTQPELRQALLKQRRYLLIRLQRWDLALDNIRQELAANSTDPVAIATRDQILQRLGQAGAVMQHGNPHSGSLQRLPALVANRQWPTLDIAGAEALSSESNPASQGVIFDMQRRIKQANRIFGSLVDDNSAGSNRGGSNVRRSRGVSESGQFIYCSTAPHPCKESLSSLLNEGLEMLYRELMSDPQARDTFWISLIRFANTATQVPFVQIDRFVPPTLSTDSSGKDSEQAARSSLWRRPASTPSTKAEILSKQIR